MKYLLLPVAVLLSAVSLLACTKVPEDIECSVMREIARSPSKMDLIRTWIATTLEDHASLSNAKRPNGPILAEDFDTGIDWENLGIPRSHGMVELFGKGVAYGDLDESAVEAVIISYHGGYSLVFELDTSSSYHKKLLEESKSPYGATDIERVAPDVLLTCVKNRFG